MEIMPRPSLLSSRDELFLHQEANLRDLWSLAIVPSRRLEAQAWKRFAEAAGCPEALTEEDRRWLEAS
jgi:hypothetical protein